MLDLLIKNATVIDGTGAPSYIGDVGIRGDRIALNTGDEPAKAEIDGTGLCVCPGFIDAHSHGDIILGRDFARMTKTSQGITTEITGQCGSSMFPVIPGHIDEVKGMLSTCTTEFPEEFEEFSSFEKFGEYADHVGLSANTKMLIGHGSLRVSVMGYQNRKCTEEELNRMKAAVREAMESGALGISSGLIYSPSCFADTEELIELSKVVAEYGGIYCTHMRNESYDVVNAVKEALRIGKEANVPVFISHHKVQGRPNWGLCNETLALVSQAIEEGQKVTLDQYPYLASMTTLAAIIPPMYFGKSLSGLTEMLGDEEMKKKIKADILNPDLEFENQYLNCGGWENIAIASLVNNPEFNGMSIAEAAEEMGVDGFEALFYLLRNNNCTGTAIYHSMCDEDLCQIFMYPETVVGTDGLYRFWGEKAHPRAWGTFPHAINHFHKEKKLLSLEAMIHKITLLPAERVMLEERGAIKDGWFADLVVFDYDNLIDKADYKHPDELCEGIEYVIVNGEIVYHDKQMTGNLPGRLLRHHGK